MRPRLLKILSLCLLVVQGLTLAPMAAALNPGAPASAFGDCPDHPEETQTRDACPCCTGEVPAEGCAISCSAAGVAVIGPLTLRAAAAPVTALLESTTCASSRTDVPPNPPPIR